ncbi:MAG TPA: LacI family DNA-binding transcriptional regulator [Microlunatus sp.]|nr:LacI family DNA-binding transcriptional regulator [Microlunatus sp.]
MVTMRDVADRAGVSIATVSFVVNGSKPVSAATRSRIERAMAELGFRRNAVARALASRRTHILAMAYPALEHSLTAASLEFFTSAAATAGRRDHHLVLWPVRNDAAELTELLGQGLVDGVVLMEVQLDDPRVVALTDHRIPFALIGRTADPGPLIHVDIDFEATIEEATRHLYDLGHRRIVLVSGDRSDPSLVDYGPYVRSEAAFAARAEGYGIEPVVLASGDTATAGRLVADRLLSEHPDATAVLVLPEYATLGLVSELRHRGRSIPADLSILPLVASHDLPTLCDPELTIMRSPGPDLGRLAVEALIDVIDGNPPPPPQLIPCTLVPGASTAAPPIAP